MRVRSVCFMIMFFGVSVLITGCGEEDIMEPEEEMAEPEDPCLQKGPPNTGQLTVTPLKRKCKAPRETDFFFFKTRFLCTKF